MIGDFRHYTDVLGFSIDERQYLQHDLQRPEGLWLSIGDSWPEWHRERLRRSKLAYWYAVTIDPGASILRIDSERDLFALTKSYGKTKISEKLWVDWDRLSRDYHGIVITPPCEPDMWRDRELAHWYVSWSCPSGCVWDTTVLTVNGLANRTTMVTGSRVVRVPAAPDGGRRRQSNG